MVGRITQNIATFGTRFLTTPGRRITAYYEKYDSVAKRCLFMSEGIYNELPDQIKANAGTPDSSPFYLRKMLALLAQIRFGGLANSRWGDHSIDRIELLAGIGNRYSSSSFSYIANELPRTILSKGTNLSPSILEFGGFGFVDSFLLCEHLEKFGIQMGKYTGVDLNLKGIVAANYFNDKVADIDDYNLIPQNALEVMQEHIRLNDHMIGIRFLAVLKPSEIISFFDNIREHTQAGDLLVINYTLYNHEAQKVGNKPGYSLEGDGSGMYSLFKDKIHYQTFLTEEKMESLLRVYNLNLLYPPHEEQRYPTSSGDDKCLGQFDSYTRFTIFAEKSN